MHFDVKVSQTDAGGWEVEIRGGNKEWHRSLQGAVDVDKRRFPWLSHAPDGEPAALVKPTPAQVHSVLGTDSFTEALHRLYRRSSQPPELGEMLGRHLFLSLLADEVWDECCTLAQAADGRVDLLLHLAAAGQHFARLPWEMMRGLTHVPAGADRPAEIPECYLAAAIKPTVTIARDVGKSNWPPAKEVAITPRVLFVIGQPLIDAEIRAGSEFITVLNGLEHEGLGFHHRVLLSATLKSLEDTIKDFQPSIVHFICHGGFTNAGGFLNLTKKDSVDVEACRVDQIFPLLQTGPRPVTISVLNACWTGGEPFTLALPLAEEMVVQGMPIVVGMAGKAADGACRLFTLSFYKALLKGSSVTEAAALGRRAGLRYSPEVAKRTDWAMPTIFLAPGVAPEVRIPDEVRRRHIVRHRVATRICNQRNPRAFCDRLGLVEESYPLLMEGASGKQVLGVVVHEKEKETDKSKPNPKFGKSRALRQLAAKAVREGHLACLVELTDTTHKPADLLKLAWAFYEKLRDLGKEYQFERPPTDFAVYKLWQWSQRPETVVLPPKLLDEIHAFVGPTHQRDEVPLSGRVVGAALWLDLIAILDAAKPLLKEFSQPRVLLLLDNAHLLPEACAKAFVDELLKPELPLLADGRVRVALSFSTQVEDVHEQATRKLQKFFSQDPAHTLQGTLGRFDPPAADPFPYCQFFLHYDLPRAVLSEHMADAEFAAKLDDFYLDLHKEIDGIPSRLETPNDKIDYLVLVYSRSYSQVLVEADNEKILSALQGQGG